MYTTNALESVNYQLRKVTRNRGHFPNDDALIKLLYLAIRKMERHGRRGIGGNSAYSWTQALNQFHIYFPGRLERGSGNTIERGVRRRRTRNHREALTQTT